MATHEFHSYYYDATKCEPVTSDFTLPAGTEMTAEILKKLIDEHRQNHLERYEFLKAAYDSKYGIYGLDPKPDYKPDNRLAADFAYDITETFEGYFIGVPLDVKIGDEAKQKFLNEYMARNFQEDVDAELSKMASKFGHGYEMFYQDDEGNARSVAISPMTSFMVYDNSVLKRPMFFVRYVYDEESKMHGSFSDANNVYHFEDGDVGFVINEPEAHAFGEVPAIDFLQNNEKRGLYEGVLNLIEAYNRVISEKANDVEYFADAYMVVTGTELDDDFKEDLREYKLINLFGDNEKPITVQFLAKPNGDAEQENLINRLEMLIFKMCMVPDITDETFSTASGTALKMRMMPMNNLARNKERKFTKGVKQRMKLLANYPAATEFTGEDWQNVEITMHRNMPEDLAAEAQVAGALSGIVSEETQLAVLSCVDDPQKERERKEAEQNAKASALTDGMPTNRTSKQTGRKATMYEITSVLNQRRRGQLTYNNALRMLTDELGLEEERARTLLDDKDSEE